MNNEQQTDNAASYCTTELRTLLALALTVAALTLAAHWPCLENGFTHWDEDLYFSQVEQHPSISLETISWAFTSVAPFYYHPLTWLAHVLDHQLWGWNPRGHHAGNVVIHAANAVLVVALVWLLTGAVAGATRSERLAMAGAVGIVFGIHPLQVESVAWVAERKTVLCGLFCLASLFAYVRAVRVTPTDRRWWWAMTALFAAALLSKPMAVSLPLVMLALDFFPLQRAPRQPLSGLLREKALLFGLTAALAVATVVGQVQSQAVADLGRMSLSSRGLVAVRAVIFYLWKLVWPRWLSPLYPMQGGVSLAWPEFYVPLILCMAITGVAVWRWRRTPAVLAAWIALLALLGPVSGVMQVGSQAVADRFMYLAMLPALLLLAAGAVWLWRHAGIPGRLVVVVIVLWHGQWQWQRTREQIPVWHGEETLWPAVLVHFPESGMANLRWARVLAAHGQFADALPYAQRAVEAFPDNASAHSVLGLLQLKLRRYDDAVAELQIALRSQPTLWAARYNLACAYSRLSKFPEAFATLSELLAAQPQYAGAAARDGELAALRRNPAFAEKLRSLLPP